MSDDWKPDWIESRPGYIAVPDDAKDEFHERVFQYLQRSYDWGHSSRTVHVSGAIPFRVTELIANTPAGPHQSRLWVANAKGGLVTWTVGTGEVDLVECERWEAATADAVSSLGDRVPVAWRAYLAQAPPAIGQVPFQLSAERILDDGLTLTPVGGLMTSDQLMNNFGHVWATVHWTALVRVDGVTQCWAWTGDGSTITLRRLRLLSAILSLAWDAPWFLRDGPNEHVGATWHGSPGPVSGLHYKWADRWEGQPAPLPIELPEWFGAVEQRIRREADRDSPVERALLIHHEAMLVARQHPSLGLLAFVASIETLAAISDMLERCAHCRTHIGSTARFKTAIASVLPNDEAMELAKAYDRRSRTIHDGQLHGHEDIAGGWGSMSLYQPDEALQFEARTLVLVQKASRALLWRALEIADQSTDPFERYE